VELFNTASDGKILDQPFPIEIAEIEPLERFQLLESVEAVISSTPHTPDSNAIHIRENDATFVYTADTGVDETLSTFARRVDLLLMECSFVKDKTTDKHLQLDEAIHLIRRAQPGRAMLTHFYKEWDDVNFEEEVGKYNPGIEVVQAVDGLRISIQAK